MMILRMLGTGPLAQLMGRDRRAAANDSWLLFGPTEPSILEPPVRSPLPRPSNMPTRWAAE